MLSATSCSDGIGSCADADAVWVQRLVDGEHPGPQGGEAVLKQVDIAIRRGQ
jgi:hypothetical protein